MVGMEQIERTVFLSYRRTNFPWALAIFQDLTHHGYDVFFDFTSIASGDFEQVILGNITARAHFLVLLTPSALERCDNPTDWLRCEIETALASQRNIVPLMVEGCDFGTPTIASQLTGKLAALKGYNALNIPSDYFFDAMGRLRGKYLNVPLKAVLHPASPSAQRAATEQKIAANAAPKVQEEELTAQQWFERAFASTDPDEKLRFYSEAIRIEPGYAAAFNGRGVARDDDDVEGMLQDFDEAIRLRPDYAEAFLNRGSAHVLKGDVDGALRNYDEAIRLKPDYAWAFYNRAIARCAKGDLEGELQDCSEAIRLNPGNADFFNNRANARSDKGDLEGALQDYNEAIRLDPANPVVFSNRGVARGDKGDVEGALRDYNEAIRLNPGHAGFFNNRANARSDKGDVEGALQDHNEAIRLGHKPSDANRNGKRRVPGPRRVVRG
jgi:tetratricopeptide (TPR) repeat protein